MSCPPPPPFVSHSKIVFNLEQIWTQKFLKVVTNTENRVRHLTNWAIERFYNNVHKIMHLIQKSAYVLQTDKLHMTIICHIQSILYPSSILQVSHKHYGRISYISPSSTTPTWHLHYLCYRQTDWLIVYCTCYRQTEGRLYLWWLENYTLFLGQC